MVWDGVSGDMNDDDDDDDDEDDALGHELAHDGSR